MFGIEELKNEIRNLRDTVKDLSLRLDSHTHPAPDIEKDLINLESRVGAKMGELENKVSARLIDFEKEIFAKSFESMESIMKYTREVSLIETLANQIKDKDLISLQTALLQPVLNQRYEKEKTEQVNKVNESLDTSGDKILTKRKEMQDLLLVLGREKKDTKDTESQLKMLDWIIEGLNK